MDDLVNLNPLRECLDENFPEEKKVYVDEDSEEEPQQLIECAVKLIERLYRREN